MTEVHRMTVDEVVSYFLEGEGVDVLRDSLRLVCQQLMDAEGSELVGAERGERNDAGRGDAPGDEARAPPGRRCTACAHEPGERRDDGEV